MFKDLRPGFQVSMLDKTGKPQLKTGNVVSVSNPRFQSPVTGQFQTSVPERIIDLTIECDGKTQTYVVQESSNVAVIPNLTISCANGNEPIINEVKAMLKNSQDVIGSVERHKETIVECEHILKELNPQFAQNKAQEEEIANLKQQVSDLKSTIEDKMGELTKVLQENMKQSQTSKKQ